ncbi:hypothetical protein ElyMa_001593100 [Elysia marginata]|uniref:Uncharacterized protein n=1 Tax=Elysia marginata TaxID=1093978 RepID=A0AAV4JK72_9GAST|nr:hypothetical protein ElyMa_001593100 [Elysia marginata]
MENTKRPRDDDRDCEKGHNGHDNPSSVSSPEKQLIIGVGPASPHAQPSTKQQMSSIHTPGREVHILNIDLRRIFADKGPVTHQSDATICDREPSDKEPAWAKELKQTLFDKVDSINYALSSLVDRIDQVEKEVKTLHAFKEKVTHLEESVYFLNNSYDSIRHELKRNHGEVITLTNKTNKCLEIQEKVDDLEQRSKRENLLFFWGK